MLKYDERLDRVFHALADPTRRDLIERLGRGALSVSDLAEPLPMTMPAVLQHLRLLEDSGLVRSEKVGRVRTCRLDPAALQLAVDWAGQRRQDWETRLDRLGVFLGETAPPAHKKGASTRSKPPKRSLS